jgi:CubicO group peptidase (beta-lactamase class C family)
MNQKLIFLLLLVFIGKIVSCQELNTIKLDELFNSLEKRDEAMGSIVISKKGKILYQRTIGNRFVSNDTTIPADIKTNYRIWSITKTYTATMILQMIEEGKLSLKTTLNKFFPLIPNAETITIQDMLNHKSGIHDFTQNDSNKDWDTNINEPMTKEFMASNIAQYLPDFQPNQGFRYSNSNYLLLGYIIEKVDENLYETSLTNRITSKIGMTNTYFGVEALDSIENKALSYRFNKHWETVDEGEFSGLIPAGAGGIVSTTSDMALFIEALFNGQLISKRSLNEMIPKKDEFYGFGMMQTSFQETINGYGHTGGSIASESSLFYYPKDSLTIAYATNGIVIKKENILNNVLKIYYNKPFAVSMNRYLQALLILGVGVLLFIILKLKYKAFLKTDNLLYLGYIISTLFWLGFFISGLLYGSYNYIKDGVTILDSFYSSSGTFMSSVQFIIALLLILFLYSLYKSCKKIKLNFLPILSIIIIIISMVGSSLFPFPNSLNPIFINVILITIFGPLLASILWKNKNLKTLRLMSVISLILMITSTVLLISRPSIPVFVSNYFGLIQRLLYFGLTLWLFSLSFYFIRVLKLGNAEMET